MKPLEAYDISNQLERLGKRPLFVWHGARDEIVPFSESTRLHEDLTKRKLASKAQFMLEPNGEHKVPMAGAIAGVKFFSSNV